MREQIRRAGSRAARRGLEAFGYEIRRKRERWPDFDAELFALCKAVGPYTMTSTERIVALADAARYVVRKGIRGDLVECGVWYGGSAMAIALTLQRLGATDRRLWLYDTFTGMPDPGAEDVNLLTGESMTDEWSPEATAAEQAQARTAEEVRAAVLGTGYDPSLVTVVEGRVEVTIPAQMPERVALLRLDTDWYQSTRHELEHLYPRLEPGGVLIVDDYGHFRGARQAVDEYFAKDALLLNRIDYSARMAVK
jgi:hypothetical protein